VYGADWREPRRAAIDGGEAESDDDVTTHGDRFEPRLAAELEWCRGHGWDRSGYTGLPRSPRRVLGAGPIGPTARTARTSRALWWTDLDGLVASY
jgi:hypothetical protein